MYIQSMNNIKTIIIPMDSLMFDLNLYRYQYYKELCHQHQLDVSIEQFHNALGNMYTMYDLLPYNPSDLKLYDHIEQTLYDQFKYTYLKPKEGMIEILHYAKSKNINIAVISLYHKDHAIIYLKKAHFYDKIDYLITPDNNIQPLPKADMINHILEHFQTTKEETLVLSSFDALTKSANEAQVNVVYVKDLVDYNPQGVGQYYNVVSDLYSVLILLLFEKYEEYKMFSNLLGMNSKMSKEELEHRKEKLHNDFKNDDSVLNVIDHTYGYHISQLNEHYTPKQEKEIIKREFSFNEEDHEIIQEESKEEVKATHYTLSKEEGNELNRLLSNIEDSSPILNNNEQETEIKENIIEKQPIKKRHPFLTFLIGIGDSIMISIWILVVGMLFYILFSKDIHTVEALSFIPETFEAYYSFINSCMKFILDELHLIYHNIPSYNQFMTNTMISKDAIILLNVFIANTIIISLCNLTLHLLFKRKKVAD